MTLIRLTATTDLPLDPCAVVPASDVLDGFAPPQERGAVLADEGGVTAGLWEATPYAERFNDFGATEMAVIVSGRVRITPDGGAAQDFGPGEVYLLKKGFKGTFEVLETLRKYYMVA